MPIVVVHYNESFFPPLHLHPLHLFLLQEVEVEGVLQEVEVEGVLQEVEKDMAREVVFLKGQDLVAMPPIGGVAGVAVLLRGGEGIGIVALVNIVNLANLAALINITALTVVNL